MLVSEDKLRFVICDKLERTLMAMLATRSSRRSAKSSSCVSRIKAKNPSTTTTSRKTTLPRTRRRDEKKSAMIRLAVAESKKFAAQLAEILAHFAGGAQSKQQVTHHDELDDIEKQVQVAVAQVNYEDQNMLMCFEYLAYMLSKFQLASLLCLRMCSIKGEVGELRMLWMAGAAHACADVTG